MTRAFIIAGVVTTAAWIGFVYGLLSRVLNQPNGMDDWSEQ